MSLHSQELEDFILLGLMSGLLMDLPAMMEIVSVSELVRVSMSHLWGLSAFEMWLDDQRIEVIFLSLNFKSN